MRTLALISLARILCLNYKSEYHFGDNDPELIIFYLISVDLNNCYSERQIRMFTVAFSVRIYVFSSSFSVLMLDVNVDSLVMRRVAYM